MAGVPEELHKARATVSSQSNNLEGLAQLNVSIKDLTENVAFYDASEKGLKNEFARETEESTRIGPLFGNEYVPVLELQTKLVVKNVAIK